MMLQIYDDFLPDQPWDVRKAATEVAELAGTYDGDEVIFEAAGQMIADLREQFFNATRTFPRQFKRKPSPD
jgi:hypothetical protein